MATSVIELGKGHSPLGGSATHRFLHCTQSVTLSAGIEDLESDHATLGTAAHALLETCLRDDKKPWTYIGSAIGPEGGIGQEELALYGGLDNIHHPLSVVDVEMAQAVQVFLNAVDMWAPNWRKNSNLYGIEYGFHCPSIHPYMWGRSDFWYIVFYGGRGTLHIWDYKHGAGVVVEADNNPQGMYYACGVLEALRMWGEVDTVVIHIVQPRAFHYDGPVRNFTISTDDLADWLDDVLIPGMHRALHGPHTLESGEHCRFCPARLHKCPKLAEEMEELDAMTQKLLLDPKKAAPALTNEELGRYLDLFDRAKIVAKAADNTAFVRLQNGHRVPGRKLVPKMAHRVWKDDAEQKITKVYGKKAYETKLKTPAAIEAMPEGAALVAELAYKPETGLTVAKDGDARPAVSRDVKALFTPVQKGH